MALIDKNSLKVGGGELNLFGLPATQVAIKQTFPCVFYPKNSLESSGPIIFEIPANPNFIDVKSNTLIIKLKILNGDGTALDPTGSKVAPANYLLNSLWSQIRLFAGSKLIWDSHNVYAYKAIVEAILGYCSLEKDTILTSALYYEDGPETDLEDLTTNAKKRAAFTETSAEVELAGGLHIDCFSQQRLWPPYVGFSLELFRNIDEFVLHSAGANEYKVIITDARISFKIVETVPSLNIAFEKQLAKGSGCKFPIRHSQIKVLHVDMGRNDIVMTQLHNGVLPRRIIVCFVKAASFYGNYKSNPFNFLHCNVNFIQITAAGRTFPYKPLEPDFSSENYIQAYHMLNDCMKTDVGFPTGLTRKQFKNGYTFFCFDLSADCSASEMHFNTITTGSVELQVKLNTPLLAAIKVINYIEFDSILTLDKQRHFYLDYSI